MALPSSGQLAFSQVIAEFGKPQNKSLNQYYGVAPGVPTSGTLSLSHFYGKSGNFYRFWRLYINNTENNVNSVIINEFELREISGGADITTPTTPITASIAKPISSGESPERAIDGNLGSLWRAGVTNGNPVNQWIRVDLGVQRSVRELAIYSGTIGAAVPRIFELQASNDDVNYVRIGAWNLPSGGWPYTTWRAFPV